MKCLLVIIMLLIIHVNATVPLLFQWNQHHQNRKLRTDDVCISFRVSPENCYSITLNQTAFLAEEFEIPSPSSRLRKKHQRFRRSHMTTNTSLVYETIDDSTFAVFVQTEFGFTGTIPMEGGGFQHISPQESSHLLIMIKSTDDTNTGDVIQLPDDDRIIPSSEDVDQSDPDCLKGKQSEDGLFCCSLNCNTCSATACSSSRSCHSFPAPCSMLVYHRVTVAYTKEAKQQNRDLLGLIQLAIAETNLGYTVSKVPIRLVLADTYQSSVEDTGDSYTMLMAFRGSDRMSGNIAVLLSQSLSSCGRAFLDCTRYSTDNCAYAIVRVSCATGYYSFGHEIGHVQGLDHNIQVISDPNARFKDGHGHVLKVGYSDEQAYRTVMSYAIIDEKRILYFSNPDVQFNGLATGILGVSNNARVLRATRYAVTQMNPQSYQTFLTESPTLLPTVRPTSDPTSIPTAFPTVRPVSIPTPEPTSIPTVKPTSIPTIQPTSIPTTEPTLNPTVQPTLIPTSIPTVKPTSIPTVKPTSVSTIQPTSIPTTDPTSNPTVQPTSVPTAFPTVKPTSIPTLEPNSINTVKPTSVPTNKPSLFPTFNPSFQPSVIPTLIPTHSPSILVPTPSPTLIISSTEIPTTDVLTDRLFFTRFPTTEQNTPQPFTNTPSSDPMIFTRFPTSSSILPLE